MTKKTGNLKVLIVDDSTAVQAIYKHGFRMMRNPYEVRMISNGEDAITFIKGEKEDAILVILLDITIPGDNGLEVIRKVRALDDARSLIPVIAVTNNAEKLEIDTYKAMGFNGFVEKPFDFNKIAALLPKIEKGELGNFFAIRTIKDEDAL